MWPGRVSEAGWFSRVAVYREGRDCEQQVCRLGVAINQELAF